MQLDLNMIPTLTTPENILMVLVYFGIGLGIMLVWVGIAAVIEAGFKRRR